MRPLAVSALHRDAVGWPLPKQPVTETMRGVSAVDQSSGLTPLRDMGPRMQARMQCVFESTWADVVFVEG